MQSQQTAPQFIPLNRLVPSKRNVRKTNRNADVEGLAASIKERGLLQNLGVSPLGDGRFEVDAGGRRLAALKLLAKRGEIAKDFAVLCLVGTPDDAHENSLTENVHRVAMDVMDEVEAFAVLIEGGASIDDAARKFGCTHRHIEQRLALARLSPKLKNAYRRGDISLDAARAFCLVDDHSKQDAVFKLLGCPITHAANVRAHLTEGKMRANDRLVRYLSVEAYEAAGGAVLRDLFQDEDAYIQDPALLTQLVNEKLETVRAELLAAGWSWVTINLGHGRYEGAGNDRIYPTRRPMTKKEKKALASIESELEALDAALQDADADDARWRSHDELTAQQETLMEATTSWDKAQMAHAGVVLSIDYEGKCTTAQGIVLKADVAKIRALQTKGCPDSTSGSGSEDDMAAASKDATPPWEEELPAMPKALARDLSDARTRAIRLKVSQNTDLGLALCVFGLVRSTFAYPASGLALSLRGASLIDHEELEQRRVGLGELIPDDLSAALDWVLGQNREVLLELLALLVAGAIDLTHEGASIDDRIKQKFADRLSSATALDMRTFWLADASYWSRLSKSAILDALKAANDDQSLDENEHAALIAKYAKLPKPELVSIADKSLSGSGYLPEMLMTPFGAGGLCLTEAAEASLMVAAE